MPDTGVCAWKEITSMSRAELARFRLQNIGYFQNFNLFPALTAAENIELVLNVKGWRRAARNQAQVLLEQVGLGHQANQNLVICQEDKSNGVAIALLY